MSITTNLFTTLPQFAVNAGVFVGMVVVTIVGWKFGKQLKEPSGGKAEIHGAILQDNMTLMMVSEANRVLAERIGTNTHVTERNTDELKELKTEVERLNRNFEKWFDSQ